MEDKGVNRSRWLSDRLSRLQPSPDWQPNLAQALLHFRAERQIRHNRQRRRIGITVGFAVMVLMILAFPVTRTLAGRYASACIRLLSFSKVETNPGYTNFDDRKPSPDFTVRDSAGRPITLADLRGRVVLLTFWTTNCATCDLE